MLNLLKKNHNIQEAHQTLKIIGVAISSHIIFFWFFPISRHFWITHQNQNQLVRSRKTSCNWEKKFFSQLSQKERFLEPITVEPVSATVSIGLFWWSRRLYISSSLFYFIFVVDNAKPTCLDCVNSNIYSCILSLLKLHGRFWFMNYMCCICFILT